MKKTIRNVMVATVASGILLSACAGKTEADKQQPRMDTSNLQAPSHNPQLVNGKVAPANNAEMDMAQFDEGDMMVGTPAGPARLDSGAAPQQPRQQQTARKESGGMFDWAWKKSPQTEPQVNTMDRRVPALNQNPSADFSAMGASSYEAAAPVDDVRMAAQSDIVVAEEVIMMDDTFTPVEMGVSQSAPVADSGEGYPNLASVPLRPERVNALDEKEMRMADMEAARSESTVRDDAMNAQMQSDMNEWQEPQMQAQADVPQDAGMSVEEEFAALVAAESVSGGQEVVVIEEESPAVVVDSSQYDQAPAPITMADTSYAEPQSYPAASEDNWAPAAIQPQAQPVVENEWVSLDQDPAQQMAVPVEQVNVSGAPEVVAVSSTPYMPADETIGGIELTPPSAFGNTTRTLPESRYAARRQAVYMQRYGRTSGGY